MPRMSYSRKIVGLSMRALSTKANIARNHSFVAPIGAKITVAIMKVAERQFTTISGVPVEPLYGPGDIDALDIGKPGEFPFTRGIHRDMYRGKLWTMRQFSGFATPEETNSR